MGLVIRILSETEAKPRIAKDVLMVGNTFSQRIHRRFPFPLDTVVHVSVGSGSRSIEDQWRHRDAQPTLQADARDHLSRLVQVE